MKHGLIPEIWQGCFGQTKQKNVPFQQPPSKGEQIVICHNGSTKGFVPNFLLLCGKKLFENMLIIMMT